MNFPMPVFSTEFYLAAIPIFILLAGSMVALMQAVFKSISSSAMVYCTTLVSLGTAFLVAVFLPQNGVYLEGAFVAGNLALMGQLLILCTAIVVALLYRETWAGSKFFRGEIASLFLMVVASMLVLIASEDLITLFVSLEMASIGLYALVGYIIPSRRSQEGAIKYFVLGSFAAAVLLFGFALLYASIGSMRISEIVAALPRYADHNWVRLGGLLTLVGLAFKLALAPFHLWAPDAYEAAPTGITAFMATTVKVMILIVSLRLFGEGFSSLYKVWLPAMMFLAAISMILGNVMALVQNSLKRMFAYSSIAHSGYLAVAICALSGTTGGLPVSSILFYLFGYVIASLGVFAIIMWLENEEAENLSLDDISGLAKRHPWASFALAVFLFSFAGMPPTVGFFGKFFVFNAAIASQLYAIVIIGVIGSAISLFYYLRVIVRMYMTEPVTIAAPINPLSNKVVACLLGAALVSTLLFGTLLPSGLMERFQKTSSELAKK